MKKLILVVITSTCFNTAHAMEGHNGIRFDMTQKDVEAKGFVCRPPKPASKGLSAECKHMDFTGVAFDYPTANYTISIGESGTVNLINADFSGNLRYSDYQNIAFKVKHFFPNKKESMCVVTDSISSEVWKDENNAAAKITFFSGIRPYTKDRVNIGFFGPGLIK